MYQRNTSAFAGGFSLVELLLVLGVIACLVVASFVIFPQVQAANRASALVPTLRDARAGSAPKDWAREAFDRTGLEVSVLSAEKESLTVSLRVDSSLCARLAAPLVGEGWSVAIDDRPIAAGLSERAVVGACNVNPDVAERTLVASVAPVSSVPAATQNPEEGESPRDLIWNGVDGF